MSDPGSNGHRLPPTGFFTVGCFEILAAGYKRWRVTNTRTSFEHVTYGSEEEVRQELARQSAMWDAKAAAAGKKAGPRGAAWRNTNFGKGAAVKRPSSAAKQTNPEKC